MKYIVMCGGNYKRNFETPKPLIKINGEELVRRTVRLLKEAKVKDIAISSNDPIYEQFGVEVLKHRNEYVNIPKNGLGTKKSSRGNWLNAYYPMEEPACYLAGDVYYTEEAIKNIVNAKVDDTLFICVPDKQDGRKCYRNIKGREPIGYKVENQKVFRKAINELFEMIDEGKFDNGVDPISWHLYRQLNGLELGFSAKDYGFANNIFKTKGKFLAIDNITTDIDTMEDVKKLEELIKLIEGGISMIKVKVIENFHLGRFNELQNLVRVGGRTDYGYLYVGDIFECPEDLAKYLLNETHNPANRAFIEVMEVMPEKKEEVKEEIKKEDEKIVKPRVTSAAKTKRKSIAKK